MRVKPGYLDNSSATRLDEEVLRAMEPFFFEKYAVATSEFGYSQGIEVREALEGFRGQVAESLGANEEEIVFTSGSTESTNMALKGVSAALIGTPRAEIVTSAVEDFPVLNTAKALEKTGFRLHVVPVDGCGVVDLAALSEAVTDKTGIVSIQSANQEIGTLQNVAKIAEIAKSKGALLHIDATHSFTRVPLNLSGVPADLVTISAHTIHGPKGVGALYIRDKTPIRKWMDGGFQEGNRRAGIENLPGIAGFAQAIKLVTPEENERLAALRDRLIASLLKTVPDTTLNGHPRKRLPQNANVTFHFVEGESITLHLDMRGYAVSTGSACFSRSLESSHVIRAIGGDHERAHGSVRFTFGRFSTREEVDGVVSAISEVVKQLRDISPLKPKEE